MAEKYRHLYVIIEHEDGKFLPVSLENDWRGKTTTR